MLYDIIKMKVVKMKEIKRYYIDTLENGKINLVKIINSYNNKDDAKKDLIKLSTGKIKEKDLLKKYSSKNLLE